MGHLPCACGGLTVVASAWSFAWPGRPCAPSHGRSPPLHSPRSSLQRASGVSPARAGTGHPAWLSITPGWHGARVGGWYLVSVSILVLVPGLPSAFPRSAGGQAGPSVPRCLSVCPAQGIASLLIGKEFGRGLCQPDLAEPHWSEQPAASPSGSAGPAPSGQSLLLIKGINWHAACCFQEALASVIIRATRS